MGVNLKILEIQVERGNSHTRLTKTDIKNHMTYVQCHAANSISTATSSKMHM
jgi:hypothetical protein